MSNIDDMSNDLIVDPNYVYVDIDEVNNKFINIVKKFVYSDTKKKEVRRVLNGNLHELYPDIFPDMGAWGKPISANMADIITRDMGESLSLLPTYSCFSTSMSSQKDRDRASRKNKIIGCYINNSRLQEQMPTAMMRLVAYGSVIGRVDTDFEDNTPYIRTLDPIGTYPEKDHRGRLTGYFEKKIMSKDDLLLQYPEFAYDINGKKNDKSSTREIVFYHNKEYDVVYLLGDKPKRLQAKKNPIGRCMASIVDRSGEGDIPRGQLDDIIPILLAKTRMALLALRTAEDVVNAQLIVPRDVQDVPQGPNSIIRTDNPEGIRYVPRQVAPDAWREQQQLDSELKIGGRFPENRTGAPAGSGTVTGAGQDALLGAYDSQIDGYRVGLARWHKELMMISLEVDDKVFGDVEKTLIGNDNGSAYQFTYSAHKIIDGDYSVSTRYGLMAGLNPSQMLVFGLQALQSELFSKGFLMGELPIQFDVEQQKREIDIEKLNATGMQILMGLGASIPQMMAQGVDVTKQLNMLKGVMKDRRDGKDTIDSMIDVLEYATEQEKQAVADPNNPTQQVPGQPGLTQQQPQGQAGGAGGAPDLGSLLASLNPKGQAGLSASIQHKF